MPPTKDSYLQKAFSEKGTGPLALTELLRGSLARAGSLELGFDHASVGKSNVVSFRTAPLDSRTPDRFLELLWLAQRYPAASAHSTERNTFPT